MMTCEEARAFLEAIGGEAPRDPACAAHLRSCSECAAYAARLPAENEALTRALARDVDEVSFQRVRRKVAARIDMERSTSRSTRRKLQAMPQPSWSRGWVLPIAALIVLSLLTVIVFSSQMSSDNPVAKGPDKAPESQTPTPIKTEPKKAVADAPKVQQPAPAPKVEHKEVAVQKPAPTPPPAEHHADNVKPAPDIAKANQNNQNQANQQFAQHVNQLRNRIREQKLLDDIEQLTIAFNGSGDLDAKSTIEDAELRLERILSLEKSEPEEARQTLADSRALAEQLRNIQESVVDDAPAPVKSAMQRTVAALDDAAALVPPEGATKPGDAASVAMAQAESHYSHEEYAEALNGYKAFTEKFPNDHRAVHAHYSMAFILQKKMGGRNEEARAIYQSIADAHSHGLASHALYHIGESFEQNGDAAKALAVYKNVLKVPEGHARQISVKAKVAFLEAKLAGTKLAEPGWANGMQKTHLTRPRTAKIRGGGK